MKPASGVTKTFIDKGFTNWTAFPPDEVWSKGVWFEMLTDEQKKAIENVVGDNKWESWVVNGQGTPGNFLARIYVVNDKAAADVEPLHPLLWPEAQKIQSGSPYTGSIASGGYADSGWMHYHGGGYQAPTTTKPKTTTVSKTQAPALPTGIRFRCAGCGHWFKQDGLAAHATNCCPGKEESRESDWALLCECCMTLDDVSSCKPGFPRPKKEVVPKEQTEVKKDAADVTSEAVQ